MNAIDGVVGGESLAVTSSAGGVILVSGAIGANVAIGTLTFSSTASAGLITTQNAIISIGDVTLSAESVLIDGAIDTTGAAMGRGHVVITSTFLTALTKNITTSDGDITLNGFTRLDQSLTLQSTSGDISINGTLDSNDLGGAPDDGLTIITATGNIRIQADLGTGATPGSDTDGLAFLNLSAGGVLSVCETWVIASTITFTPAVEVCGDWSLTAGRITFGSTLNEATGAAGSNVTLTITNPSLTTGDITFTGAVGGTTALDSLMVTAANDVTFRNTVRLVGDLTQQNGTGTTTFNGTSGTGIGGQLIVNTRTIIFNTADVVTVGAIQLTSQDTLTLNANAGLNAGASTISLLVNQDGAGNHDFTQAGSAVIQTTNNTANAVRIVVGVTGSASIGDIRAGIIGGVVSITADRQIRDNLGGEAANITAHAAALRAGTGIGVGPGADVDIDTAVNQLAFSCTGAGANISNLGNLTLTAVDGLTTSLGFGGGTLFASGSLTIAMNTQVGGTFNFIAGDDVGSINDLTIAASIIHLTGLGEITFQAGDDIIQTAGTIQCFGAPVGGLSRINFTADHEASGADGDRGGIVQTGGNVIASELQIRSFDAVMMNQATNDAAILAAVVTGAGQSFTFRDANNLTIYRIPNVGGVVGLTTSGGNVTLTTGGQLILGGSGEDILAAGAIVSITAGNGFHEGASSTITANQLVLLGTGTFTVDQQNTVEILAAEIEGSLTFRAAGDLDVGTVNGVSGVSTGSPGNGGDVTLVIDGEVRILEAINTQGGTGGVIMVSGGVLNAALIAGAGNITILSNSPDLVINVAQTSATTLNLSATRDVIINAVVTTTGVGADVLITADSNNDGIGGVQVTAAGQIVSADEIVLSGSDLFVTAGSSDSIRIDADGANDQLVATGNITLRPQTGAPTTADIVIDGRIHSTGGAIVVDARDAILAKSAIIANNGSVTFRDAVVLTGALQVTAGGTVLFEQTVNDDGVGGTSSALNVTAVGTTTFTGAVGNLVALSSVVTNGGGTTEIRGGSVTTTGVQVYADDVILAANTILTSVSGGNIVFQGTVNGNHDLTVNTAGLTDFQGAVGNRQAVRSVTTNAGGSTRIGGGLVRTTGPQTYGDAVIVAAQTLFTSTAAAASGASITFQATVNTGGHNVTINAGTQGNLTVTGALAGGGTLLVQQANVVELAAVNIDTLTIQAATTSITFHGPVQVTNTATIHSDGSILQESTFVAGQNVTYTATGTITVQAALVAGENVTLTSSGASILLNAPVTATNGDLQAQTGTTLTAMQALTAGNQVSLIAGSVLTLAEAADITAGVGGVFLTGPQIITAAEITTNSGNVSLTGAVTLTGDVTIETGAAGSLLVTGTIDSLTPFAPSLFLSTDTGDITVTGNIGSVGPLNAVEIVDARNVTFGSAITANHLLQQSGLGTTTIVGAVNTFDAAGIQLTTQSIQFAMGTSSMDSHGQIITLTADAITLPTTFTRAMGSTVTLQTLHATTSIGLEDATQDLNFTDEQLDTIETQNLVIGSATHTAGIKVGTDGTVSLDEHVTLLTAGSIGVFGPLSLNGANNLLLQAGDDIRIDGSVATAAGQMQVLADDNITMGANGLITSASGNVVVRADADADSNGNGGGIIMMDGAQIIVGTGTLQLLADESIILGQLVSSNTTANAIKVTSQHGGIVDGGDSSGPNIVVMSPTAVVMLTAANGIGSQAGLAADAALETQVNQLVLTNSATESIAIDELDAITILGAEQNGLGAIILTAGGTMTVAVGGPGVQSQGGAIALVTTGRTSDLVLNAAVNSRGGDVSLLVGGNLTQAVTAPITTNGGTLTETIAGNAVHQGAISTTGGNVRFDIDGNFTQTTTAPISTGGGMLSATVDGNLSLAAAVSTSGGAVSLTVGNNFTQAASAPITTGNGNLSATVGGALFMQDGALTDVGSGTIAMQAVGNVTLGQVRTTNASGNAVLIRSTTGGIIDGGDVLGANIVANSAGAIVTLSAANGIGSTIGAGANAALETQINALAASNSTTGNISIEEADALFVRSVIQSAAGNVTVQSIGDLTVVAGQPGVSATNGNILLAATDATSNVLVASTVQTSSGAILINAANNFSMTAVAQILSQTGNVTVNADADHTLGGSGGALTMADGATINAGSGQIAMNAGGNITIGQVITTATVSLASTSGGIIDGGDIGGADIIAENLVIRSVTGIGNGNALDTAVAQLALTNALSGGIRIDNNTGGLLTIGTVDGITGITNNGATAAVISVINNGAVNVNGAVRNATGGDVFLRATNNGGTDDDLVINAVIAATNGNGNIELQAGHHLLINDTGSAVDISVVNGGKILGNAVGEVIIDNDVVIQSATGAITAIPPELINVSTPQITNLGVGTIFMTVQRPLEIGTVIVIDWGDGTIETFVVTEANQQDLVFEHKYLGPPNPLNPAEDIPLKITVLAPGFTSGANPSPIAGTQLVANGSYDPNIQFFADGQTVTPASFGVLNETVLTTVFKTPGDGLASFAFDLTPPVVYLTFPEQPKVDASLLAAPQAPAQVNVVDDTITRTEELLFDERVVLLEVFTADGKLQDRVVLSEDVLDDLDGVVRGLPDGHYRFVLREAGETRTRLLQEFDVRQGRIAGGNDNIGDRPPSLMKPKLLTPPVDVPETGPADALRPDNAVAPAAAGITNEEESSIAWTGWRAHRAWRDACSPKDGLIEIDDCDSALVVAVEAEGTPEAAFGRGARLLRKYGMF